jgi:hypothetical protein
MAVFRWAGVVPLFALLLGGCGDGKNREKEEAPRNPLLGAPQPGAGGVRRAIDRPKVQNDLRNVATFYNTFFAEMGRGPKTVDEFMQYIMRDARQLHQVLSEGYYVLVLVARPGGATILAYEKTPDAQGLQMAVRGDGSVSSMTAQELQKALQNPN